MGLEDRIEKAEEILRPMQPGGDDSVLITIVTVDHYRDQNDELQEFHPTPVGYSEPQGDGQIRIRYATYDDPVEPSKAND